MRIDDRDILQDCQTECRNKYSHLSEDDKKDKCNPYDSQGRSLNY